MIMAILNSRGLLGARADSRNAQKERGQPCPRVPGNWARSTRGQCCPRSCLNQPCLGPNTAASPSGKRQRGKWGKGELPCSPYSNRTPSMRLLTSAVTLCALFLLATFAQASSARKESAAARAERSFFEAQAYFNKNADDFEAATHFALACFDW